MTKEVLRIIEKLPLSPTAIILSKLFRSSMHFNRNRNDLNIRLSPTKYIQKQI